MKELSFIPDRLDEVIKEMGLSGHTGFLQESSRKVKKILSTNNFYVDVFKHSASGAQVESWFEELKTSCPTEFTLIARNENVPETRYFGQLFSTVAFIAFDETLFSSSALKQRINYFKTQYRLVIVIDFFGQEPEAREFCLKLGDGTKLLPSEECTGKNVEKLVGQVLAGPDDQSKLKRRSYLNSLQPLFSILEDVFAAENKAAQTRKLLGSQSGQILRKDEQAINQSDLAGQVRQMITKFGQDLDKNFRAKYEELNKPNTGYFSRKGQEETDKLRDFRRETLAEKPEKVGVTLEEDFKAAFLRNIEKNLTSEFRKDEQFLKTSLDELLSGINVRLQSRGIAPVMTESVSIDLPDHKKVISSYCYLGRSFNGEIIKQGINEYFVALRDYIGVIMVATGLLAPLSMIATLGDENSSLSWLKYLNKYVRMSTAFIALALIVYGIYDLRKRIPRKREEEFKREMQKAKELLLSESKRMYGESARDWTAGILQWLREVGQNITFQIDRNINTVQTEKMRQLNQEKIIQQRQQSGIDLLQRNIQAAERIKEQLAARFKDLLTEKI